MTTSGTGNDDTGAPRDVAPDAMTAETMLSHDVPCLQCSYNLRGLDAAGVCPECRTPISRSLGTDARLAWSSPEYLAKVQRGLFLVVAGIFAKVALMVLLMFGGIAIAVMSSPSATPGASAPSQTWLITSTAMLIAVAQFVILLGWWLVSEPDPRFANSSRDATSRRFLRGATFAQLAFNVAELSMGVMFASPTGRMALISTGLMVLSAASWAVAFFAQMIYVRGLGERVPDAWIIRQAKLLLWLGPVLVTVGLVLLGLGPLIALVMYWNLLDRLRKQVKRVRRSVLSEDATLLPAG